MPSPALQRSSSLQITIPSGVAGNLKITTAILPLTTTTPLSDSLKRKHSEISTASAFDTSGESSDMFLPTPSVEAFVGPPSPVPTEIIDVEPEDFVSTSKRHGVKVRDFGLEPISVRTPEVWVRPIQTLAQHDTYIRRPQSAQYYSLTGKSLWRLLKLGWVTQEEAKRHWTESDWQNLKAYENRPQGPYPFIISPRRPKPTAAYRAAMRIQQFGEPEPEDVSEEMIYVPPDEPGMWDGDKEEDEPDVAHHEKKRKVDESSSHTTQPTSTLTQLQSSEPLPDTPILTPPTLPAAEAAPQIRRAPSITVSPASNVTKTPPLSRSSSRSDLGPATPVTGTEEPQPRQTRRGLSRTQTLVLVR